jgi:hypothetical protein
MSSRWRYNWMPFAAEGIGQVVVLLVLLVLLVCVVCR